MMLHNDFFNSIFSTDALVELLKAQTTSTKWTERIDGALEIKKFSKGQLLLNIGQTPDYLYFLKTGGARGFYFDHTTKEQTFYLWDENSVVIDIKNYLDKVPSDLCIEISEDTQMLRLHRSALDQIIKEYPEATLFLTAILDHYCKHHRSRDMDQQSLTANEKLGKIFTLRKKLYLKFSRKWIASYLGMSRQWLYDITGKNES